MVVLRTIRLCKEEVQSMGREVMNSFGAWFVGICTALALIMVLRVIGGG